MLQETKGILRARKLGIKTPTVYLVDQQTNSILMEKVRGITVKDWLREGNYTEQDLEKVLTDIGKQVAILHDGGLVHGDLTTSNMIIGEGGLELVSRARMSARRGSVQKLLCKTELTLTTTANLNSHRFLLILG